MGGLPDQRRLSVGPAKTSIRLTDSKWCLPWTPNHASQHNYMENQIADHIIEQKVGLLNRLQ